MIYATVADFILAFGEGEAIELSNLDDPVNDQLEATTIRGALTTASAEIDSYVRSAGYSLPLSEVPSVLIGKCCDIARYRLDRNRAREEVRQRYLDAVYWLKDLARGTASLGIVAESDELAGATTILPGYFTRDRTFTMSDLSDY